MKHIVVAGHNVLQRFASIEIPVNTNLSMNVYSFDEENDAIELYEKLLKIRNEM